MGSLPQAGEGVNKQGLTNITMWLLILEALAALGLLVFIVWWTMFSGRRGGEREREREREDDRDRDNH